MSDVRERRARERPRLAARRVLELPTLARYAIAIGAAAAATTVRLLLEPAWGNKLPFVLFFPAIMVGGWAGGFWPGILTTLLSAGAATYFWIEPPHSWRIADPVDGLGVLVFIGVGIAISALNEGWRRGAAEMLRSETGLKEKERAGRIEAESAARQLRLAVDASPTAMLIIDRNGSIVFANAPTEQLLGYTARELAGRIVDELVPPRFRAAHPASRAGFFQALAKRPMGSGRDLYALRKDGSEVPVEIGLSPFETADETLVLAAVTDITERKRTELERAGLLHLEQEAARRKDQFLATLSHELRNPLAPIRSAVHLLAAGEGREEARVAREIIARQLDHLVRLVDDLLDLGRISQDRLELRPERVTLRAVLDAALESSRPLFVARGQLLSVSLPEEPVWVDADLVRLAQVFTNLLNNAAKFSPDGGRITLEAAREGDTVLVRVRDEGEGFDAATREILFEMFARGPSHGRTREGLGIGLALAKRLVELHGGSLEGSSPGPGGGSTFEMRLAAAPPPAVPAAPDSRAGEPATRHRILVAEDNADTAEALAMLLVLEGHEVRTAKDGEEACAVAEEFRPEIALLDIGMPKLDGYEVARRIREQPGGHGVLLVALTGWGASDDRRRSEDAGFAFHLTKPVDPEALTRLLSLPWPPPRDEG